MLAFRVALGLVIVLLLAPPASAQFSTDDLNGLWTLHATRVGVRQGGEAGWLQGFVLFSRSGAVLDDEVRDQGETLVALRPGALSVSANGDIMGLVGSASVQGRFLSDKNQIVGVATADAGALDETNTFFVLVRTPTGEFSQADATGTWRLNTLQLPAPPTTTPEYVLGQIVVNSAGAITGGQLTSSNGSTTTSAGGTLLVNADGTFAGQLDIGPFGNDHTAFSGTFVAGRGLMVGAASRSLPNEERNGMFVLQREPTVIYAPADAAGTWTLFGVEALTDSPVGPWLRGTLIADAFGVVTGGTLTDGFGNSSAVQGGFIGISGEGLVLAEILVDSGLDLIFLQGSMLPSKAQIFAVNDHFTGSNRLFNGRFDIPDVGGCFTNLTSAPSEFGWTITSDGSLGVDLINGRRDDTICWDGIGGTNNPDGVDQSIDIDGSSSISQSFATVPGQTYELSLFYSRNPAFTSAPRRGLVTVTGNATLISEALVHDVPNSLSNMNWVRFSRIFVADSTTTTLSIAGDSVNGTEGFAVDNVRVSGELQLRRGLVTMVKTAAVPPPPASTVQFTQPIFTVKENVATATIGVSRIGTLTGAVTVPYTATGLTAVANVDFKPVSGILTFPANVGGTKTFTVSILNNTLVSGNRSVTLTLGTPTGNAGLGSPAAATLIIQDDETPGTFKVDKGTYTVLESAGTLAIIVRRTGTSLAGNVSVAYATIDGTASSEATPRDYTATSGRLTFNTGETMKTVSVQILKDSLVDGDKTFTFVLSEPSSGATLDPALSSALVTIKDTDVGGQIKFAPSTYSVNEGAGQVRLTIVRTGGTAGGVLVDFTIVSGTATGIGSGTLTFGVGNTSATLAIGINQDSLVEGNEQFQVQLSNPRGGATLVAPSVATVTIVDDESAFQFKAPTFTVTEGTANAVITVLRTGPLVGQATVNFTATPGTAVAGLDFNPVSGTLTFPANTPSKTFNVPILNDTLLDGNRGVTLGLNTPTGGVQFGTVNTATLTIVDNEQAGQFKLDKTAYTVAETAGFVTITVMRAGTNLVGNVSVTLTATNGSATSGVNYTAPAGALTFAAGETTKTVKIPITPDHVVTGPLVFNVALTGPTSGATLGTPATAPVTITNTEVGGQIKLGAATILVAESAGSVTLVVQRTGGLAGNVSIDFTTALIVPASSSTASGADFTAVSGTLTFGFGVTSASIVVPITRDEVTEPNEAFQVRLANPRGGATLVAPSVATVTIADLESMVQFNGLFTGNFPQVVRTGSLATEVRVDFVATDGTALAGIDYLPLAGTLTFRPNVAIQNIPLTIIRDNIAEGSETFTIALRNPTAPARLGPDSVREFAITDNDFGGNVGFEATLYTATEGGAVDVAIVRTGGVGTVLTVQWQASPGSATTPASGSVTFGPSETRKTFTISALTDEIAEEGESVTLTLSVPVGAATLGRTMTTLAILDASPVE